MTEQRIRDWLTSIPAGTDASGAEISGTDVQAELDALETERDRYRRSLDRVLRFALTSSERERHERMSAEADHYRATLHLISAWDCLNPPQTQLCADFAWLKRLVDETLAHERWPGLLGKEPPMSKLEIEVDTGERSVAETAGLIEQALRETGVWDDGTFDPHTTGMIRDDSERTIGWWAVKP